MTKSSSQFGHERLRVYQHSIRLASWADSFLRAHEGPYAAFDHLRRASAGIPQNIAAANAEWSKKERCRMTNFAYGSALECAGCLDILQTKDVCAPEKAQEGKRQLHSIVNMLIAYRRANQSRVREDPGDYAASAEHSQGPLFDHEKLNVYQSSLRLAEYTHRLCLDLGLSMRTRRSFDTLTTTLVLNIAEGNGRFSARDRLRFIGTANTAVRKTVSLLDVVGMSEERVPTSVVQEKHLCSEIAAMLAGLRRVLLEREDGESRKRV